MKPETKEKLKSLISAYNNMRTDAILEKIYDLCVADVPKVVKEAVKRVRKNIKIS